MMSDCGYSTADLIRHLSLSRFHTGTFLFRVTFSPPESLY